MTHESRSQEELLERRLDPRYAVQMPASLLWGQERYEGTVRNVSTRGVYLTLEVRAEELRAEDAVMVMLGEPAVSREATIVRVEPTEKNGEPVGVGLVLHEPIDVRALTERFL